jgi:hypothetical protein
MRPAFRALFILGGYFLAYFVAIQAVALRVSRTSVQDAQASAGMHAFGDMMLFIAVFGVTALVPTVAVLLWLRRSKRFWTVLSAIVLPIAITAPLAAVLFALGRHVQPSLLATLAAFSVLRILIAPICALVFLVCSLIAPEHRARLVLLAATAMEVVACVCGGFFWVAPFLFHKP